MLSIQAIQFLSEFNPHNERSEGFRTVPVLFINDDKQDDHKEGLLTLKEDEIMEVLYSDDDIKKTTTLFRELRCYLTGIGFH